MKRQCQHEPCFVGAQHCGVVSIVFVPRPFVSSAYKVTHMTMHSTFDLKASGVSQPSAASAGAREAAHTCLGERAPPRPVVYGCVGGRAPPRLALNGCFGEFTQYEMVCAYVSARKKPEQ